MWIDEEHGKPVVTGKDGCVSFKVPKGYHVIHAVTRGMTVERPYQVVKAKLHEFTINLVWERRQEYVSRALERQTDDVEQYMARSMRKNAGSFPAVAPAGASPAPAPDPAIPEAVDSEVVDLTPVPRRAAPAAAARKTTGQVAVPATPAAAPGAHAPPARAPTPTQSPARPAPATARGLPAPGPAAPTVTRATVSLRPLAPQPAQPAQPAARKTTGQVAVPAPQSAASNEDAPIDLDMSGALGAQPADPRAGSTGTVRKPTR